MKNNEYLTTMQLSHLLATDIGINGDEATIIDAVHSTTTPITLNNLKEIIAEKFHVEIEQERIENTVTRLVKEKKLTKSFDIILLTFETMQEISKIIIYNEQTENTAIKEWLNQYQVEIMSELSPDTINPIRNCILNFIRTFFLTHGADCYKLITGGKQDTSLDTKSIAKECAKNIIPEYSDSILHFLEEIFSDNPTSSQNAFLLTQYNKAVHYLSMVVDTPVQSTLTSQLNKVTIYLDTAVLYRLLNLQGENRYKSLSSLISFCRKSNISLKVFKTSYEELKRRINYDAQVIINNPIPISFARIGYDSRTSENYISTFWKEQSESGVSAKDFNFRYSNIFILLQEFNIDVDERDYITEFNLEEKKSYLSSRVQRYYGNDAEYTKSINAVDHDAECLTCIEHLQIKSVTSVIEAKTFFLSTDWSLNRLQRYDNEYKDKTDLVVHPSQLLQIFSMTSPTTDYFEAFLGLFSSSHTSFGTSSLDNFQIQQIMGLVAMYKGTTAAFAEKILTSQLIQTSFAKQETEEERKELIDNAMISQVRQMEESLENMEESLEYKEKIIEDKETKNKQKDTSIEELIRRVTNLEGTNTETTKQRDVAETKNSKYQKHFESQADRKSKRCAFLRVSIGWLLISAGIIGLLICTAAFIPSTSSLVSPIFIWIGSSATIRGDQGSPLAIIGIISSVSVLVIRAGFACKKNGFEKISKSYYNGYIENLS